MVFDQNLLKSQGLELKLEEFVERWSHRLPVLIVTTTGYCGCDDYLHQVSTGEYYWVYDVHRQTRLVAETLNSKYLSIPIDYPVKFNLIESSENACTQCLSGSDLIPLLQKKTLTGGEMWVQFEGNKPVHYMKGADNGFSESLGPLKIIDQYEQKYLLAYTVQDGFIHSRPIPIPVYLDIRVDVFVGFRDIDEQIYRFWSSQVETLTQKCSKSSVPMCNEVIMFPKMPRSEDYDYLHHLVAGQKRTTKPAAGPKEGRLLDPNPPPLVAPKPQSGKISSIKKQSQESNVEHSAEGATLRYQLPEIPDKNCMYESLTNRDSKIDIYARIDSVETLKEDAIDDTYHILLKPTVKPSVQNMNFKKQDPQECEYEQWQPQCPPKQPRSTPIRTVKPLPREPPKKPVSSELYESIKRRADTMEKLEREIEKSLASAKLPEEITNTTSSEPKRGVRKAPLYDGILPPDPPLALDRAEMGRFLSIPNQNTTLPRTNSVEPSRAVVGKVSEPLTHIAGLKQYSSASDVPKDVDFKKLGISDVIHCFKLLNLGEYSNIITQKQIDGELLMSSMQDLKSLGVSQFDVTKLQKFIDGWRPTL